MLDVTFDSIYWVGKLVGYNVLYKTKRNRRKLFIQRSFVTIHVIMAILSAARNTYWAITRQAIPANVSGIMTIFRLESRCLTPICSLIYLYAHGDKFFRINEFTRSYYDNLSQAQKNSFRLVYWLGVFVQICLSGGELFFIFVWSGIILDKNEPPHYLTYPLDMISIFYSNFWYSTPMVQYFLTMNILARSLHKSCSELHKDNLDTSRLHAIALNIRTVLNLCELVSDYYGIPLLLGIMCSALDFMNCPYIYLFITYFLKLHLGKLKAFLLFSACVIGIMVKFTSIYLPFMVSETFYQKKRDIKNRLHDLLRMTKQDGRLHREVFYLSLRYTNQDEKISAAGILSLTYKEMTSIITSCVAFLVLQIQFMIQDLQ